jgi:hypothetical protein
MVLEYVINYLDVRRQANWHRIATMMRKAVNPFQDGEVGVYFSQHLDGALCRNMTERQGGWAVAYPANLPDGSTTLSLRCSMSFPWVQGTYYLPTR